MSKYIDHIFYINLDKRIDRKTEIEDELNKMGLVAERFQAYNIEPGFIGCSLSHLYVLKLAKKRNYKNVLILEDDFSFLVNKQELEDNLTSFFENNIDYDVCFLSYNVIQNKPVQNYPFIMKALEVQTASGYLVNGLYLDKLINLYEYSNPLLKRTNLNSVYANDQIWKDYQKVDNWFYFTKRIGCQRPSWSNTGNFFVDLKGI